MFMKGTPKDFSEVITMNIYEFLAIIGYILILTIITLLFAYLTNTSRLPSWTIRLWILILVTAISVPVGIFFDSGWFAILVITLISILIVSVSLKFMPIKSIINDTKKGNK